LWIACAVVAVATVVLPFIYCSLPGLNFGDALGALAAPYCSGCLNVTILYIWLFIAPYFFFAVWLSVLGIRKGRAVSQERWHALLAKRLQG